MKVLVLGGTGFIGRRLVEHLLRNNCDVTIATSGKSPNPFGDAVSSVVCDRFDITSIEDKLSSPPYFDVLFDQICFGPDDAQNVVDVFGKRIGNYVFVSSGSVYTSEGTLFREGDFDPVHYDLKMDTAGHLGYGEGKKNAEAYLFQKAPFPVAAARFPIVIGHDDSTYRFQGLVGNVASGENVNIPEDCGKRNYVWVDDAGRFLAWLGMNKKSGVYNAASPQNVDAVELSNGIGESLGKKPIITRSGDKESATPYYSSRDQILSVEKAEAEGFAFTEIKDWIGREANLVVESGGKALNSIEYFVRKFARD